MVYEYLLEPCYAITIQLTSKKQYVNSCEFMEVIDHIRSQYFQIAHAWELGKKYKDLHYHLCVFSINDKLDRLLKGRRQFVHRHYLGSKFDLWIKRLPTKKETCKWINYLGKQTQNKNEEDQLFITNYANHHYMFSREDSSERHSEKSSD